MGARAPVVLGCLLAVSCTASPAAVSDPPPPSGLPATPTVLVGASPSAPAGRDGDARDARTDERAVRLAFTGDLMLGRGVAPVVAADPGSVFEHLRPALVGADLAFGNLESPLTARSHLVGEHALEADPAAATLLAGAGFDVVAIANNHATDAGPDTVLDTAAALDGAGLVVVGAGPSAALAAEPLVVDLGGVTVGIVAYDGSGGRPADDTTPGVNPWRVDTARATVTRLARTVDLVVVGLHAGVEHLPRPDPALVHRSELLASWGADVVWGHGSHTAYPVETFATGDRRSVVAPGLGNALFDQSIPGADRGALLEVLARDGAVVAFRTGVIDIDAGRSTFAGWDDPTGDAVALDGEWWTPTTPIVVADVAPVTWDGDPLPTGYDAVDRAVGDVTGTGVDDLVVAYRRPMTPHPGHVVLPEVDWTDPEGRTAHVAVYTVDGAMRWGSALMPQPIDALVVCDGSLALGFTAIDRPGRVAGGAWFWDGFGFRTAAVLPGPAQPTCTDIDGDGRREPALGIRTAERRHDRSTATEEDRDAHS